MPKGKIVNKVYKTRMVKTKSGEMKPKKYMASKSITKATNQTKGAGVQTVYNTEKGKLRAREIQRDESIRKAEIAGKTANIGEISAAAASAVKDIAGAKGTYQATNIRQDVGVNQAIQGGVQQANTSRDDDEDSPWVD